MARPTSYRDPIGSQLYGVVLGVHPSTNRLLPVELWDSTQSASTASSLWSKRTLPPSTLPSYTYTFPLRPSTVQHHFKARHPAYPGYSAGAFTPRVSARPTELPTIQRPPPMIENTLGNVELPRRDLWLTSAETVKVGTQQTTANLNTTARFGPVGFSGMSSTDSFILLVGLGEGYARSRTTGTAELVISTPLPVGVQVYQVGLTAYKESTADSVLASFYAVSTGGLTFIQNVLGTSSTGWVTSYGSTGSTAIPHTVLSNLSYGVRVQLNPAAAAADARIKHAIWRYRRPTYKAVI